MLCGREAGVGPTDGVVTIDSVACVSMGRQGMRNVKVLPLPGPALIAHKLPPCASANRRARNNPIPRPPFVADVRALAPWMNSEKIGSRSADSMPIPFRSP